MDDLSKRALKGIARFQVALALIIFLPAWSIAYWQGWLYWLLFGAACFALTLYFLRHDPALVERRMKAGPGAEKEPRQKLIMTVASVSMVSLYLVSALDYGFGWSYVPAIVSLIANAFVLLGFAGIFWTFRENAYAAATMRVERGQPVISTGAYALVRHPMYSGGASALRRDTAGARLMVRPRTGGRCRGHDRVAAPRRGTASRARSSRLYRLPRQGSLAPRARRVVNAAGYRCARCGRVTAPVCCGQFSICS